jgi:hypothetical protein
MAKLTRSQAQHLDALRAESVALYKINWFAFWAELLEPIAPMLERLPAGAQTRSRRMALNLRGAIRILIVLVVGAVLYALADRLI